MSSRQLPVLGGHHDHLGATTRKDSYWVGPVLTASGLLLFFGYLTFRAFQATYVWFEPYVSPTVAPPLFTPASGYPGAVPVEHAWLGAFPPWWPELSPAVTGLLHPRARDRVPRHLLLLPEGVLPRVRAVAARLRGARRPPAVPG